MTMRPRGSPGRMPLQSILPPCRCGKVRSIHWISPEPWPTRGRIAGGGSSSIGRCGRACSSGDPIAPSITSWRSKIRPGSGRSACGHRAALPSSAQRGESSRRSFDCGNSWRRRTPCMATAPHLEIWRFFWARARRSVVPARNASSPCPTALWRWRSFQSPTMLATSQPARFWRWRSLVRRASMRLTIGSSSWMAAGSRSSGGLIGRASGGFRSFRPRRCWGCCQATQAATRGWPTPFVPTGTP